MKMYDLSRPSAACAATEFARFPVEAQATVSKPNSRAFVTATDTTRSLNDHVGWQTESFFTQISRQDRKSTRLNSSHSQISYAVFCLKKTQLRRQSMPGGARHRRRASPTAP